MKNQEIINLTKELIRIPSTKHNIQDLYNIIDYVEGIFQNYSNVIIRRFDYDNKPSIIIQNFDGKWADIVLNWHLDVVPPSDEGQLEPVIRGNTMYARGAWDMKWWASVIIKVMEELIKENFKNKKVSLILTTDEESWGFSGAANLTSEWWWGDITLIPDSWSSDSVITRQKWVLLLWVRWYGVSCHGSRPWLWKNALDNVFSLYYMIKNYLEDPKIVYGPSHWGSTVNINTISWGEAPNVIPEIIDAKFDIRFTEEYSTYNLYDQIKLFVQQCDCEITSSIIWENLHTPSDFPELISYIDIARNVFGKDIELDKEHSASDWRYFDWIGSNVILQRPTTWNIHSRDEWVKIDEFEKFYDTFLRFIKTL